MGLVVLVVSGLSLVLMVKGVLGVPIEGSIPLFMLGVALSLFATTSIGIFMGTIARSMPQLGLLVILVLLPRCMAYYLYHVHSDPQRSEETRTRHRSAEILRLGVQNRG